MALDINKGPAINPTYFLVVGPAGSGLTSALNTFSDFGFMQVADVEPGQWVDILRSLSEKKDHIAFTLASTKDNTQDIETLIESLPQLKEEFPTLNLLYLTAPEDVLIQRYVDSGKPHPFEKEGLEQAVSDQRQFFEAFAVLKKNFPVGYYAIDTSTHTREELRAKIAKILGINVELTPMTVYIQSFGFKHGLPKGSELVFDMRFIKNPYYQDDLRPLTGFDQPVRDFIFSESYVRDFLEQWTQMIGHLLPHYHQEGKLRLSIAVGCTGGQHRSVCMAEALADYIKQKHHGYNIVVAHREKDSWPRTASASGGQQPAVLSPQ